MIGQRKHSVSLKVRSFLCHYTVAFKQYNEDLKFLHGVTGLVEGDEEGVKELGRGSRTPAPASI